MRQSIEKQREMMSAQRVVTVMFHGSRVVLAVVESIRAREVAAQSLSVPLTDLSVVAAASSLSRTLSAWELQEFPRHRTRSRTSLSINKFPAEEPVALSALAVSAVNPNKHGLTAVATVTTIMTEQRRCRAA
jgi:hypothetical protein